MDKLFKSLLLGAAAGLLAAMLLFFLDLPMRAIFAGILHWLGLGMIVAHVRLPLNGWLSGALIALLMGVPFAMLSAGGSAAASLPLIPLFTILGGLLGYGADRLILRQPGEFGAFPPTKK